MTRRLLNEGFPVTIWDRNDGHAEPVGPKGADIAQSPGEVVSAADAVITMLPTPRPCSQSPRRCCPSGHGRPSGCR
jgi:3-hydroxyisobutyrate dehydrogenase-like beta-hydroxyacid dehydrogenase